VPSDSAHHDANLDVAGDSSPNYLRWIADLIKPHLGASVLEVGAGIGTVTELYAPGHTVLATDLSDLRVAALEERFGAVPTVTVAKRDLRDLRDDGARFDSIVMINVLEHIEDDAGVLSDMRNLLRDGGNIVIYVPALNGLYGRFDRQVGHYRRYSKWRMREVAVEAGLRVDELMYVNALGMPAWVAFSATYSEGRVRHAGQGSLPIWDRTGVPISRAIERRVRIPLGLNLLASLRA
jgi:cyclopropane fatty-acyl-phospholipid synthase-like methyltransferase